MDPRYHFHRKTGEMNDPNGMMYTTTSGGQVTYHMHFQSQGGEKPGRCSHGNNGAHTWGHATSTDLIHWVERNVTCIVSSSGGGIALDAGALGNFTAAALGSAPTADGPGTKVGLELWLNDDPDLLKPWTVHDDGLGCYGTTTKAGAVVCPSMVPPELHAGYIGDNYVWQEGRPGNRTYYVLSGSTVCDADKPWCGYPHGHTPMALLFSSKDLLHWKFSSVFWSGQPVKPLPGDDRLDVPDTFSLPDGRQAFIWLTGGYSVWAVGTFDRLSERFTPHLEGAFDTGKLFCQQSLWMAGERPRRVSLGWVRSTPYATQSLAREISHTPNGGLLFSPLRELETLQIQTIGDYHGPLPAVPSPLASGVQVRVTLNATIAAHDATGFAAITVWGDLKTTITLRCTDRTWMLEVDGQTLTYPGVSTDTTTMDIFLDGSIAEVFAGGVVHTLAARGTPSSDGISVHGANASASVRAWSMSSI